VGEEPDAPWQRLDVVNLSPMKHEPEHVTWSDYLLAALLCAILALAFAYAA
jgi:hypothetical protein